MSIKHPIVAVTGSSGAGTSTVKNALEHIFHRIGARAAVVEGDSFHRYNRREMKEELAKAKAEGRTLSHFGPEGNLFDKQLELFQSYSRSGTGERRHYVHDADEAQRYGHEPGTFTPWEPLPQDTDLLFYEGLHGGVVAGEIDLSKEVDLLIGVCPTINLEWVQKIHRDTRERGYSHEDVQYTIYRRMYDYMHYILPQFSATHINFQRIPLTDTSNPFCVNNIPTFDQSLVMIHFLTPKPSVEYKLNLKGLIDGTRITGFNTLVIPGGKMMYALELILTERIVNLMKRRGQLGPVAD
ncbi:phosphoribulokinase [Candidatus Thiodictyon syntrophicum]|jgi:phosphoribulokinase|uniref:Phosphoribulokinase n=1 Tax=Candidatus Thiodictyon syntrophicum TaxID=1166950 RepID=A0A2K8U8U1_9GAMM|nr:phosphoribulokinase [Candidatus Thiodictyon syntrophicum]AUB81974.1 phosphoribulokinase [Candidatus Thiodictyon syntrophicum]